MLDATVKYAGEQRFKIVAQEKKMTERDLTSSEIEALVRIAKSNGIWSLITQYELEIESGVVEIDEKTLSVEELKRKYSGKNFSTNVSWLIERTFGTGQNINLARATLSIRKIAREELGLKI